MDAEKLEKLYILIEKWIDDSKAEWEGFREELNSGRLPLRLDFSLSEDRQCHLIDNGYLVKIFPVGGPYTVGKNYFFASCPLDVLSVVDKSEENNIQLLREFGFTKEKGFYIPEHKVVGIDLIDGKAKVNPDGSGWTITEDLSNGGEYSVTDVSPYHFAVLNNRSDFTASYIRHIQELLAFCRNPKIKVDNNSHTIHNLPETLSRFLFTKQKNNLGEIVIGDLDNLQFYRTDE